MIVDLSTGRLTYCVLRDGTRNTQHVLAVMHIAAAILAVLQMSGMPDVAQSYLTW